MLVEWFLISNVRHFHSQCLASDSAVIIARHVYLAEKYRKSFPSAGAPSTTSLGYYPSPPPPPPSRDRDRGGEDSTTDDTDSSSIRQSPRMLQRPLSHTGDPHSGGSYGATSSSSGEPHYQFRKSNSMKLALREYEEGEEKLNTSILYCCCFPGFLCCFVHLELCITTPVHQQLQCFLFHCNWDVVTVACFSELYRVFYAAMLWFVLICKQLRLCMSYYFIFQYPHY